MDLNFGGSNQIHMIPLTVPHEISDKSIISAKSSSKSKVTLTNVVGNAPPVGKNDRVRTKRSLIITGSCIKPSKVGKRARPVVFFLAFQLGFLALPCALFNYRRKFERSVQSNQIYFCHCQDIVHHKYLGPWNEILSLIQLPSGPSLVVFI